MADDKSSKGSRFKSKWGKILKQTDHNTDSSPSPTGSPSPGAKPNYQLNSDVVDFLKPSTDKAALNRPKLDIAIAQRWPEAHDVRRAAEKSHERLPEDASREVNGWRKRRRREGLRVGFTKGVPEVIGEGGDEAPEPTITIGKARTNRGQVGRSVSARQPEWVNNGGVQAGVRAGEQDFRPPPMRRAETGGGEFSPGLSQKSRSPPAVSKAPPPPRIGISRTPTGFSSPEEDLMSPISPDAGAPPMPAFPPMGQGDSQYEQRGTPKLSAAPRDPGSLAARKQHDMRASEGMALRRASAMIEPDKVEDQDEMVQEESWHDYALDPAVQEHHKLDAAMPDSAIAPPHYTRPPPAPAQMLSPQTTTPSHGSSPFADPKYAQQRSREFSPMPPVMQDPVSAGSPDSQSPFADPKYAKRHSKEQPAMQGYQASMRDTNPPVEDFGFLGSVLQASHGGDGNSRQQVPQDRQQPSYMRAALQRPELQTQTRTQASYEPPAPRVPERSPERPGETANNQPSYMRAAQRSSQENEHHLAKGMQQPPAAQQSMAVPLDEPRSRSKSNSRDRGYDGTRISPSSLRANGSSQSADHLEPSQAESRGSSQSERSPPLPQHAASRPDQRHQDHLKSPSSPPYGATFNVQPPSSPPKLQSSGSPDSSQGKYLGGPRPSPYARGPSPADYFSGPRPQPASARSPMAQLRQDDVSRPGSAQSSRSARPAPSPQPSQAGNPAADAAFADFAGRVAHMKGVFSLTAEKEQPADRCKPNMWLRAALWWYLRGKTGLEGLLQQRSKTGDTRELLVQAHVDLAKTWWILSDPLDPWDAYDEPSSQGAPSLQNADAALKSSCGLLKSYLKALTYSMSRNKILPPPASLIQGQDTQIWIEYPRFTSDAVAVLGGCSAGKSLIANANSEAISPLEALPLGDNRDMHCYNRYSVEASINTDEADTDRIGLPCYLTVLRGTRDYLSSIVIASQSELVSLKLGPKHGEGPGLTWHDVSWKASSLSMSIRLPRGFDLTVRFHERDFRSLWNLVEYTRQVEHSLRPQKGETLVHEARLAEVQYADSANPNAFPADKVRGCHAMIWERHIEQADGSGMHKLHRGFRLLVVTDPGHKTLSSFSHEIGTTSPLSFEFITDAAANGTTAMVIRTRDESKQCRMLLVFRDMESRQNFHDVLNGLDVKEHETIIGKMALLSLNIEPAVPSRPISSALAGLQWQKLGVTNEQSYDPNSRLASTISSESLRIVARHAHGCTTDRLNLDKGELLLRLPCDNKTSVQLLRCPQADISMSIDIRNAGPTASEGTEQALRLAQTSSTIRNFTFASPADLHAFQAAITGFAVRYDGMAASLGISRRRMVVPIYHKWTAVNVRLQIVANAQASVIQLLAFMEEFPHADALCLQVKSTDVFETVKGDSKGKKWAIVCKDAKFSLPVPPVKHKEEKRKKGEQPASPGEERAEEDPAVAEEKVKRRFVNLEGLEYMEEHDDITIGFDTEEGISHPSALLRKYIRPAADLTLQNATGSHRPCRQLRRSAG